MFAETLSVVEFSRATVKVGISGWKMMSGDWYSGLYGGPETQYCFLGGIFKLVLFTAVAML